MAERPEDLNLPNSVVARIIKDALPEGVIVSKEARSAISRAASVFVLYATSCSNNFAMKAKRKTLNGNDVLAALDDMEFTQFVEPLKKHLENFRKDQLGKKEALVKKRKARQKGGDSEDTVNNSEADKADNGENDDSLTTATEAMDTEEPQEELLQDEE